MGVKGKKHKFTSDVDIFTKETENFKSKAYIWTAIKLSKKKGIINEFYLFITIYFCTYIYLVLTM